MTTRTKTKKSLRKTTAFRFDQMFLEKMRAAADATGSTVTDLIERCVEDSLHRVVANEKEKRDEATRELNAILKLRENN